VVFPNSQILGSQITNYSVLARGEGLILHTEVGIGYETPWRQVEAMLLAAAEHTPDILRTPAPFVLQRALANCAVTYELNVYCANAQRMLEIYADIHRRILDVFNQYNVQIMTPLYIADPPSPRWCLPPSGTPHPPLRPRGRRRQVSAAARRRPRPTRRLRRPPAARGV
jgi:small-conductance mechanosensitive channel